ncbi:MAG: hypothetical protein ACYSWO_04330 [Planctomycetota bacterium]
MKDKQMGVFFILISTLIYLTYFVTSACYAAQLTSWKGSKMGTAMREFGYSPLVLALLALGLGIFYVVRAERRELDTNNKS